MGEFLISAVSSFALMLSYAFSSKDVTLSKSGLVLGNALQQSPSQLSPLNLDWGDLCRHRLELPRFQSSIMAALNLSDEELLSMHGHRLPEHLRFIDAIVYHPFENNEDEQLCRDYVDRLKSNVKLDDQSDLEIVLYDDYFVPDVSKLGKFGHAENFSHYKFVYITKDFVDAEHMQLFLSQTSLINSIEDKNKQGTVIIVYKDKVPGKTPTFLSSIISLTDASDNEFHFLRLKTMFNSKQSKQRKKDLEENVKYRQIKWLRENM